MRGGLFCGLAMKDVIYRIFSGGNFCWCIYIIYHCETFTITKLLLISVN